MPSVRHARRIAQRDLAAVGDEDAADHAGLRVGSAGGVPRPGRSRLRPATSMRPPPPRTRPPRRPGEDLDERSVDGRRDVLGDAEQVDERDAVAGADVLPDAASGWKTPTAGESAIVRPGDAGASSPASAGPWAAAAETGAAAASRPPPLALGMGAQARPLGALRRGGGRRRAPEPDPPVALANLELAQAARRELLDEGRHERLRQAAEARVVGLRWAGVRSPVGRWSGMG